MLKFRYCKQRVSVFILDGKPLALDRPFVAHGTQYPANWLRLATPAERAAIGITEGPDPRAYDQRFYWGWTASGTLIPKDHEQLVSQWTEQTNTTANTLLTPTDWMVVREADNGKAMPSGIKEWRQSIRYACDDKITTLTLTQTTDELANYVTYTSPSGGSTSDYNYWPPLNPAPVEPPVISGQADYSFGGDDTISFESGSTSGSVTSF